jgi:hypothetical protein
MSNASQVVETPTPRPVTTARDVSEALRSRPPSRKQIRERLTAKPVRTKQISPSADQIVEQSSIPVWARPIEPARQTTD